MADFVLLGEKLGHSYSPRIHRLLGGYDYALVELKADEFEQYVRARPFKGANVTIPYKKAAYALCDKLSAEARAIGSVNTLLVRPDGTLCGHNTDVAGFKEMVRGVGARVGGLRCAVLGGNGGAGRMACSVLMGMGAAEVVSVSRSGPVDEETLYRDHAHTELLVNATPVGMYPHVGESPVNLDRLPNVRYVLDMIYNPHRTALLLDAEARRIPAANGLSMLVAQGARAVELFTDRMCTRAQVAETLSALCRERLNLVLIGMPGSGKSSIGRACAAAMNRPFVDADEAIERRAGMNIPGIFAAQGEAHFRALESRVLGDLGAETGRVIATGGGAVMRAENVRALRQNGVVCWIRRPTDRLATNGRPLSRDKKALSAMETARTPAYRAASQFTIDNTGSIDAAAQAAMEGFYETAGD